MSAATSKTGRNAPQTGCFEDQEFRGFKGPLSEKIQHEKLTVPDSTANKCLALAVLQKGRKSQQYKSIWFSLVYVDFNKAYFIQGRSMVLFVNTILFLLATKLRQRGSAAKVFISNLRFGDLSIWVAECEIYRHVYQGAPSRCDGKFGGYCPVLTGCCMSAVGEQIS